MRQTSGVLVNNDDDDFDIDLEPWHNKDDDDFDYQNNGQVVCDEFKNEDAASSLDLEVNCTSDSNTFKNNDALSTIPRVTFKVPQRSPRVAQTRLPDQYYLGYFIDRMV